MTKKKIPRPGSGAEQIMEVMKTVERLGFEQDAPPMEKPTLQASVNRLRRETFNNKNFYTRTKPCGTVVIGIWND